LQIHLHRYSNHQSSVNKTGLPAHLPEGIAVDTEGFPMIEVLMLGALPAQYRETLEKTVSLISAGE
jgi:hypothetical protein